MFERPKVRDNSMALFMFSKPSRTILFGMGLIGMLVLSTFVATGWAQNNPVVSDLYAEQLKYDQELAAALQPVQKRYIARLEGMQKRMVRKGDKAGALAVEAELEKLGAAVVQQMRYPIEGKWIVRYHSGATRTYVIHADETVEFLEERQSGRFTKDGQNVLVDFGDNKLERIYWNTVLVVDHYDPKASYGNSPPKFSGFAEKAP